MTDHPDLLPRLDEARVMTGIDLDDKWEVIRQLVEFLPKGGPAVEFDSARVLERVEAREHQLSTGLERGLALPHAFVDDLEEPRCVLGLSPKGVEFDCFDGRPARIIILLALPNSSAGRRLHVMLLARLIQVLDLVDVDELAGMTAAAEALDAIGAAERSIDVK